MSQADEGVDPAGGPLPDSLPGDPVSEAGGFAGPNSTPPAGGGTRDLAAKRSPIRPVGFRPVQGTSLLVMAVTVVQSAFAGYAAWYFFNLRQYDWRTYIDPRAGQEALAEWSEFVVEGADVDDSGRAGNAFASYVESMARYTQFEHDLRWLLPGVVAIFLADVAAFIAWQSRLRRNLPALGTVGLHTSEEATFIWWVVPLGNWWLPVVALQEIWRGSSPGVPVGDDRAWRLKPGAVGIPIWRGCAVIAKLCFWLSLAMLVLRMYTIVNPPTLLLTAAVLMVVASLLQFYLVRALPSRQAALYAKRMRAVEKAEAAGESVVEADSLHDAAALKARNVMIAKAEPVERIAIHPPEE